MRLSSLTLPAILAATALAAAPAPHADFAALHRRAEAGEQLTVVFFGASLTWGANATDQNRTSYRALIGRRLEATYPRARFRFVDAAIGGTGSQLGVFRVDRDVLRHQPDLVFLDFTANDGIEWATPESMASYEAIVRRLVAEAGVPVVQVLFPFKWNVEGKASIDDLQRRKAHSALSQAYGTGLGDAVGLIHECLRSGAAVLADIWPLDGVHPGDGGYVLFAEAAWQGFEAAVRERRVCSAPAAMLHAGSYTNQARVRVSTLAPLPAGWRVQPASVTGPLFDMQMSRWLDDLAVATGTNAAPLEVRFRGEMALLFGESTPKSGRFRVFVDGEPVARPGAKSNDVTRLLFNAGDLGQRVGGTVHLSQILVTGLAATNHLLRIEPAFDAADQEIRLESICVAGSAGARVWLDGPYRGNDPARWTATVNGFGARTATNAPPIGAIVATGSSSMRGWHGRIRADLAPLTVIPRGFGGSNLNDLLAFADRLVLAHRPRAVLVYEGDNDIAAGVPAEQLRDVFLQFVAVLHARQPGLRVYLLAVKPSPSRWNKWPEARRANELLAASCAGDPRLTFIDVATPMLGADGQPKPEFYLKDQLHLTDAGYDLWRAIVQPVLAEREAAFEPPAK